MTKENIIGAILSQNMVDEILPELLKISLNQKERFKEQSQNRGASLRAIYKIAGGTGDIDAIKALSEDENIDG